MAIKHCFLDSEPVGLLTHSQPKPDVALVKIWLQSMQRAGHQLYLPAVVDYEIRRELLRAGKTTSIAELNRLPSLVRHLPLTDEALRCAADLWAWTRNSGQQTGGPKKIDIDVILAAQALTFADAFGVAEDDLILVTTNVAHLRRFVPASEHWSNITP